MGFPTRLPQELPEEISVCSRENWDNQPLFVQVCRDQLGNPTGRGGKAGAGEDRRAGNGNGDTRSDQGDSGIPSQPHSQFHFHSQSQSHPINPIPIPNPHSHSQFHSQTQFLPILFYPIPNLNCILNPNPIPSYPSHSHSKSQFQFQFQFHSQSQSQSHPINLIPIQSQSHPIPSQSHWNPSSIPMESQDSQSLESPQSQIQPQQREIFLGILTSNSSSRGDTTFPAWWDLSCQCPMEFPNPTFLPKPTLGDPVHGARGKNPHEDGIRVGIGTGKPLEMGLGLELGSGSFWGQGWDWDKEHLEMGSGPGPR